MLVNNGLNSGANSFRILAEISSGPVAMLASMFFRSFSTPLLVTLISGIDG